MIKFIDCGLMVQVNASQAKPEKKKEKPKKKNNNRITLAL